LKVWRYTLPLAFFLVVVAFLWRGLTLDPSRVPSPLIDKPAPAFQLPGLKNPDRKISSSDMLGRVWLLNVWGSWCVSCRAEHEVLVALAKSGAVPIVGLNWKDDRTAALAWLQQFGDPYIESAADTAGDVAINYGVYGAPETFIIDKHGTIRHKVIGPLTPERVETEVLPIVQKLEK